MASSRLRRAWSLQSGLWTGGFSPPCTSGVNRVTLDEMGSELAVTGPALAAAAAFPFPSSGSGAGDPPAMHRLWSCLWISERCPS